MTEAELDQLEQEEVEWTGICPACLSENHDECWGTLRAACKCCGVHKFGTNSNILASLK